MITPLIEDTAAGCSSIVGGRFARVRRLGVGHCLGGGSREGTFFSSTATLDETLGPYVGVDDSFLAPDCCLAGSYDAQEA